MSIRRAIAYTALFLVDQLGLVAGIASRRGRRQMLLISLRIAGRLQAEDGAAAENRLACYQVQLAYEDRADWQVVRPIIRRFTANVQHPGHISFVGYLVRPWIHLYWTTRRYEEMRQALQELQEIGRAALRALYRGDPSAEPPGVVQFFECQAYDSEFAMALVERCDVSDLERAAVTAPARSRRAMRLFPWVARSTGWGVLNRHTAELMGMSDAEIASIDDAARHELQNLREI